MGQWQIFHISKYRILSFKNGCFFEHPVLDLWLWYSCGTGGTFNDAYSSWYSYSYAGTAYFHRIDGENCAYRHLSNHVLISFLKKTMLSSEKSIRAIFSFLDCEKKDMVDSAYMDGVIIDGTTLYILGTSPDFVVSTEHVTAVPSVLEKQFLNR